MKILQGFCVKTNIAKWSWSNADIYNTPWLPLLILTKLSVLSQLITEVKVVFFSPVNEKLVLIIVSYQPATKAQTSLHINKGSPEPCFSHKYIMRVEEGPGQNVEMRSGMRFPTMRYVRPAKPQISLRIRAVWSEPLLVTWIFLWTLSYWPNSIWSF